MLALKAIYKVTSNLLKLNNSTA